MLRVITSQTVDTLTFKLEGRLTGEPAEQVRTFVTRSSTEMRFMVDITELMFVDALGEEVLSFLKRFGAQFQAETAYSLDVCERLHLPLVLATPAEPVRSKPYFAVAGQLRTTE